jgi:hypothetical protein
LNNSRDTIHAYAFAPDSRPYGKPFNDWMIDWTRWVLSTPKKNNPASDLTGSNCAQNQSSEVWFLAGTFGGSAKRKCGIPFGKAIFFPIITKECSFTEDHDLSTEADLGKRAKEFIDCVVDMQLVIDGIELIDLVDYRCRSSSFSLMFPGHNVYSVKQGRTVSVVDGYWVFLRPLPIGKHTIYFKAKADLPVKSKLAELAKQYNKIKGDVFKTEVLYELDILL